MFGFKNGKTNGQQSGHATGQQGGPSGAAQTGSAPAQVPAQGIVAEQDVLAALSRIQDPDLRRDIVSLGFVKDVAITPGAVSFKIELTTPACPVKGEMERQAREFVGALPGVERVDVTMTSSVRSASSLPQGNLLPGVRNVIAVASGKGGV